MCRKIVDEFPTEISSTYYIPYISKTNSANGRCTYAKGRLVDKIRNLLHLSGDTVKCRKADLETPSCEDPVDGKMICKKFLLDYQ